MQEFAHRRELNKAVTLGFDAEGVVTQQTVIAQVFQCRFVFMVNILKFQKKKKEIGSLQTMNLTSFQPSLFRWNVISMLRPLATPLTTTTFCLSLL